MCGIVGHINRFSEPIDPDLFSAMLERLQHRGPDDQGVQFCGAATLGHRRLSILDLSSAGHQPMGNETESVWLTFNGEIYNFQELRGGLEERGHRFRSQTDSEVILHLWEEKRERCLDELRGMFAFAIWDKGTETLFLARDRVGKKPLKYFYDGKNFLFASELKALLVHPSVRAEVDHAALFSFFALNHVASPNTGFRGIQKLPAAHYLRFHKGAITVRRYWSAYPQPKISLRYAEAVERLRELLRESVELRMVSDVPLGAFLSGGIDSSAVVAYMAKNQRRVKTFSIGFPESGFDERSSARRTAESLQTEHHEFEVSPDAIDLLPKMVVSYEEPYADSSALPSWYLAERAREHVTVALTGDGGDEAFGGYARYRYWLLGHRFRSRLYDDIATRWYVSPKTFPALFSDDFHAQLPQKFFLSPKLKSLKDVFSLSFETFLQDDLLPKVDIATMAHGLEARSPFLDHRLLEFSASLPPSWKVTPFTTKKIFKDAMVGVVPEHVLRAKKRGFELPVDAWFRGPLSDWSRSVLLDRQTQTAGFFKAGALETMLNEHRDGKRKHGQRIWLLLCFVLWQKEFFHAS